MSETVVLDEKSTEGLVQRIKNAIAPPPQPTPVQVAPPPTPIVTPAPVPVKAPGLNAEEVSALIDKRIADAAKKQEPPKPIATPTPTPPLTEEQAKAAKLEELKNKPVLLPPDVGKGIVESTLPPGSAEADLTEKILAEMREKPMESMAEFLRWNLERKKTQ